MNTPAHDHIKPLPKTIQYEEYPSHPGYGYIWPLWDSSCSLYPERELRRIADCWNACAGIADPMTAIHAAREALEAEETWRNQRDDTGTLRAIANHKRKQALNLLTPKP